MESVNYYTSLKDIYWQWTLTSSSGLQIVLTPGRCSTLVRPSFLKSVNSDTCNKDVNLKRVAT